jgi:uncharacterized protein
MRLFAIALLLLLAAPAIADPMDDARAAYERGEYHEAMRILRVEANHGNAEAQYVLGIAYQSGKGVPLDPSQAAQWYRKAADQKYSPAEVALGSLYVAGEGVPASPREAARLFLSAAEAGNANGQLNIGISYEQGVGVGQSYAEALNWYRKAAEQGDDNAQVNLGYLYYMGLGTAKNNFEAARWYRAAAEQGQAMAQLDLGLMHKNREIGSADPVEGMMWMILASDSRPEAAKYIAQFSKQMTPDQVFEAQRRAQAWKPKPSQN